jgi:hypothetical protein
MRNELSFKVALGGICSAVCLGAMFMSGFLPMFSYAIPAFAGLMMVVMVVETSLGWAIATYCSVSLLCIFVTPNYESSLLFILFMGYYPILKYYLDRHCPKVPRMIIKVIVYNIAIVLFYLAFQYLFTSVDMIEGLERFGKYAPLVLWGLANFVLPVYDYFLGQMTDVYTKWFRKKILKRK